VTEVSETGAPAGTEIQNRIESVSIVYAVRDRVWADWIAEQLDRSGRRGCLIPWQSDYSGRQLGDLMQTAMQAADRILVIVSPTFLASAGHGEPQWDEAIRFALGHRRHWVPVLVGQEPLALPPGFWVLDPARLYRLADGDTARTRLLQRLDLPLPAAEYSTDEDQHRYPGTPTAVVGPDLPRRNPAFTGRRDLLDQLRHALTSAPNDAPVALGLHGLGGTGKTQLALEYVHRFMGDYDLIWWIPARHRMNVRASLRNLAVALGADSDDAAQDDLGEHVRFALDRLRRGEPYSRWLVVFDDVQENAVEDYLPLLPTGPGRVVLTTRDKNWTRHAAPLPVDPYQRLESLLFLQRSVPGIEVADADALADYAGDLPLALEHIAGTLVDARISPADLLVRYRTHPPQATFGDIPEDNSRYQATVATTWNVALQTLADDYQSFAGDILNILAFFSPDPVPIRWFADAPEGILEPKLREAVRDPAMLRATVKALTSHSLAKEPGGDDRAGLRLQMHQLVQQVAQFQQSPADRAEHLRQARLLLAAANPEGPTDPDNFAAYARLLPHFGALQLTASESPEVHRLITDTMWYLQVRGEYTTLLRLAESAIEHFDPDEPMQDWQFYVRRQYIVALRGLGRFAEAAEIDRDLYRALLDAEAPDTDRCLSTADGYAAGLRDLGRHAEAAELTRDIVVRRERLHDDERHPEVLRARHNAAVDLRLNGRHTEAYALDQETFKLRAEVLGMKQYQTLLTMGALAHDLRTLGRYGEAVATQEQAYLLMTDAAGASSGFTYNAMIQLAVCRRRAGQYQSAYDIGREALDRCVARYTAIHPTSIAAATNLAGDARYLGRFEEGLKLAEQAVTAARELYAEGHPVLAACRANLATLWRETGEAARALPVDLEAAASLRATLGADHPYTLACRMNVASDHAALGDHQSAVTEGRTVHARLAAVRGAGHPHTLAAARNLVTDLRHTDPEAAEALEAEVRVLAAETATGLDFSELGSADAGRRIACDLDLPMS